ncbi:MAG: hypothetical protein ABIJ61_01285 [bacterium]
MLRKLTIVCLLLMVPAIAWGYCGDQEPATVEVINDATLHARMAANGYEYTFTADKVWHLDGRVFVQGPYDQFGNPTTPEKLYVEPGTIIKGGLPGENPSGEVSALIICRGGYAEMIGTKSCPIIMTQLADDVYDPDDIVLPSRATWGGLIVLGAAVCCTPTCDTWFQVEGIDPLIEPVRTRYGAGDDDAVENPLPYYPESLDDDNSGIYRYISIRHGGYELGDANEINGMTMGAVGSGTTIDHIEVFMNLDDGYEWFGGSVCCRYLVSAYNNDDYFDYDECYHGTGQFWFAVHEEDAGNRTGEWDGNHCGEEFDFAEPHLANITAIGPGDTFTGTDVALKIRDNAGSHVYNSIFVDYALNGIDLEEFQSPNPLKDPGLCDGVGPFDTEYRTRCGALTIQSTMWWNIGPSAVRPNPLTSTAVYPGHAYVIASESDPVGACYAGDNHWTAYYMFDQFAGGCANPTPWTANTVQNPLLVSQVGTYGLDSHALNLDPRLQAASPALAANGAVIAALPADGCFEQVDYLGAFGPQDSELWTDCWTFLSCGEYTPPPPADCYVCGDPNGDAVANITDAVFLIQYIFNFGPAPCPLIAGDSNCDAVANITDAVYLVQYIFAGGPAPCADCP